MDRLWKLDWNGFDVLAIAKILMVELWFVFVKLFAWLRMCLSFVVTENWSFIFATALAFWYSIGIMKICMGVSQKF